MGGLFQRRQTVHHYGNRHSHYYHDVIAEAKLEAGQKTEFSIDRLMGVTSLVDVAGRGVVVCPAENVDEVGDFKRCLTDSIPLCCKLTWVLEEDQLWLEDLTPAS